MKKKMIALLFVFVLLTAALCSCSAAQTQYSVEKNGIVFEVDKESKTVSDGTNTYNYTFKGNDEYYRIDITYPDGSSYWWNMSGYLSSGGWSDDYTPEKYADGDVLKEIILAEAPKVPKDSRNIITILFLLAIGIFNIIAPRATWYLEYGWRYKDAEPSDLVLGANRFGGIVAIAIAVVMIFT